MCLSALLSSSDDVWDDTEDRHPEYTTVTANEETADGAKSDNAIGMNAQYSTI